MRVKCLAPEHNTVPRPGLEPGPFDLESSALTIWPAAPPNYFDYLIQISLDKQCDKSFTAINMLSVMTVTSTILHTSSKWLSCRHVCCKCYHQMLQPWTKYLQISLNVQKFKWGDPKLQNSSKWLLGMTSNRHILSSLSILGLVLGHVPSIGGCHHFW